MSGTQAIERTVGEEQDEQKPKKGKRPLMILALALVVAAGGAWWFVIRPAETEEAPVPGEVLTMESIQVNLVDGHYLKVGIALQAVEGVEEIEGSKALDATIDLFTGASMQELANPRRRAALKEELTAELEELYHGEVMGVYFTDFVTQ